jgi:hypothetical protein
VRSGEKVVTAFYRRRRSVWGEIFSRENGTGEARAASRSGVRRRGVSSGGKSTRAGSARRVQWWSRAGGLQWWLGDDRSGRGVMAAKPRPGGWDASTTARRRGGQLGVQER